MSEITTSEGEKEEVCAFCMCLAKKKCSACKGVYYCSREHQKSDWKTHSKNCQMFTLAENSTMGRYNIATRDIEMGEIILRENEPLLVAPQLARVPVCLNCYVPLKLGNRKPCGNCGWPLCLDCTRHGPECQLTMKYRESKVEEDRYSMPVMFYNSICVLRAIALREKSPDDYKKLLNLESHYTERMNETFDGRVLPGENLRNAHSLKMYLQINDLDEEEIARIIGVVSINGFVAVAPNGCDYVAVFDKASYNTHDCCPNSMWNCRYDANSGAKILIRAARMIPKGQSITIIYMTPLKGTNERRKFLRQTKYFDCNCERCKDPTEFGTMFSAVKCFRKDCIGYMLPPTFLVSKDTQVPDFICNKCKLTTPSTQIDEIMEEVSTQFSKIEPENQNELKKFIENQSKILHRNHFHIVKAKIKNIVEFREIHEDPNSLPVKFFQEHINRCKKLSGLLEILAPTDYETRGMILLSELLHRLPLIHREILTNRRDCFISIKEEVIESKKLCTEAYRLLRFSRDQHVIPELEEVRSFLGAKL